MAQLPDEDRRRIWRGLMRHWSSFFTSMKLTKAEIRAAVDATDTWIDGNQTSYNAALPTAARNELNQVQKTLLFCAVALVRAGGTAITAMGGIGYGER